MLRIRSTMKGRNGRGQESGLDRKNRRRSSERIDKLRWKWKWRRWMGCLAGRDSRWWGERSRNRKKWLSFQRKCKLRSNSLLRRHRSKRKLLNKKEKNRPRLLLPKWSRRKGLPRIVPMMGHRTNPNNKNKDHLFWPSQSSSQRPTANQPSPKVSLNNSANVAASGTPPNCSFPKTKKQTQKKKTNRPTLNFKTRLISLMTMIHSIRRPNSTCGRYASWSVFDVSVRITVVLRCSARN